MQRGRPVTRAAVTRAAQVGPTNADTANLRLSGLLGQGGQGGRFGARPHTRRARPEDGPRFSSISVFACDLAHTGNGSHDGQEPTGVKGRHRARCEDRIRNAKDAGMINLRCTTPLRTRSGAPSSAWPARSRPGCRYCATYVVLCQQGHAAELSRARGVGRPFADRRRRAAGRARACTTTSSLLPRVRLV